MSALSTIVALPIASMSPSIAEDLPDQALVNAAALLVDKDRSLAFIEQRLKTAERTLSRWVQRNPKPVMREAAVGSNAEYEAWFSRLVEADESEEPAIRAADPNADLKSAMCEVEAARRSYSDRMTSVLRRCGLDELKTEISEAKTEIGRLVDDLCSMEACTIAGLAAMARVAHNLSRHEEQFDHDVMFAVMYELGVMVGDIVRPDISEFAENA